MLKAPELPNLYFVKSGNYTYARMYRNAWQNKKSGSGKTAVKTHTKTVGRIDNSEGVGIIKFSSDFCLTHPQLNKFSVSRVVDEAAAASGKYKLVFTPLDSNEELYAAPRITCVSIGMSAVLDELLKCDVLPNCLKEVFGEHYKQLLAAAYYMVMEPDAKLARLGLFARGCRLPAAAEELYPAAVTRLLAAITPEKVQLFFKSYLTALTKKRLLSKRRMWALDSTSVSTYAKLSDAEYGHNKQEEALPQINVMMITDEDSSRPLYYQYFNGSIPDVSECVGTFELLLNLGVHSFVAVADRGFFNAANMAVIADKGYHFLMCVPYEKCTGFQKYIDEAMLAFSRDNLFDLRCGQNVYTCKEQTAVEGGKHKAYVHVFYHHEASEAQIDHYQRRLKEVKELFMQKKILTAEEQAFLYANYLTDKDSRELILNDNHEPILDTAVYNSFIKNAGICLTVSDNIKYADVAYRAYVRRKCIEDTFATLKTRMQLKRFRVSSEDSLCGKCFIEFIALTLYSFLYQRLEAAKKAETEIPHHSLSGIMDELRGIKDYYFSNTHEHVINPLSKKQLECLDLFKVKYPHSYYDTELTEVNRRKKALKPHGSDLLKEI